MAQTLAQHLVNAPLPEGYKTTGPFTNKWLHDHLVSLARTDPKSYVNTALGIKRRGDEIATIEGISVGLDDIRPLYKEREAILDPARKAFAKAKTRREQEKVVLETQTKLLDLTKTHPGSMTHMALSGARGNAAQLMKMITAPLATVHPKTGLVPHLLDRSYAEGLTPMQYWLHGPEVRANEVQARISVSEPGEVAKVMVNNMASKVVTHVDCGTMNGIRLRVEDPHAVDRYTQEDAGLARNTLITPRVIQELHRRHVTTILVRSPMTCASTHGVCQHCQGLDEKGHTHAIGTPVGGRAAQAMSEPLTQMALSARHGTLTVKGQVQELTGLKGARQLLDIPAAFQHEALLAPVGGVVTRVERAPQGGHYVFVGTQKSYAGPNLTLQVKVGDAVEAGDRITDGVPHPAKIVAHKGLGAGRVYFADALHGVYKREGQDIDKRHVELLAKTLINHVRLTEADPEHPEFLKGDTINYNAFRDAYTKNAIGMPPRDATGRRLAREVLHHTVGTVVTPSLARELDRAGVKEVFVAKQMPQLEFVMRPFTMNPLLDRDWMARLAHRYLKQTIADAAHIGDEADIHTTHPVPAYAFGAEMGHGPEGRF